MREFYTPAEMAKILDVPPSRVRTWASRGLIRAASAYGPPMYRINDVVRMAILCALAPVADGPMEFVDAHGPVLHSLCASFAGNDKLGSVPIDVHLDAEDFEVRLKPALVEKIRERLTKPVPA